ncbi:MAG: hypothetical protein QM765_39700 [Myxococcales bacterium]
MAEALDVFVALVEVRPEKGCEAVDEDVVGAFARFYVVAKNVAAAEAKVRKSLTEQRFDVVKFEFCKSARGTEWENPDSPEAEDCILEAKESGAAVLGRLDTWTDED